MKLGVLLGCALLAAAVITAQAVDPVPCCKAGASVPCKCFDEKKLATSCTCDG